MASIPISLRLLDFMKTLVSSKSFLISACILCTWKLLRRINSHISVRSLNNFQADKSWDWTKEIVLITGGSNGIGARIVRKLSDREVTVVIWDIASPPAELLKHPSVHYYRVDVTSEESIVSAARQLRANLGDPSVLINNAGIAIAENIVDENVQHRKLQFEVNVFAQMRLVQEFLPAMAKRNHGHIVTMASASSFISTTQLVTYASTKAAIMAFHEGVAQELRMRYNARRVRTTIVFPHYVRTDMVKKLTTLENFPELLLEPEYVADEVVKQVLSGNAGRLILPPSNSWLTYLRALPPWYMYRIHSMDPDVYKPRA